MTTAAVYSINGINISKNITRQWFWRNGSKVIMDLAKSTIDLRLPGRNGNRRVPSVYNSPVIAIKIYTPRENYEALMSLMTQRVTYLTSTQKVGRELELEYLSSSIESYDKDQFYDVTFLMRVNDVFWRDQVETEYSFPITTATQYFDVFPGLSGEISDGLLFIGGNFGQMEIYDSAGSWVKTTGGGWAGTTSGLLYDIKTGQAWRSTTTLPWVPVTDRSKSVDVSAFTGFQIVPYFTDPATRKGYLKVITQVQTSTVFKLKTRGAYIG